MRYPLLFLLFICLGNILEAQYVYTINADSVKITNHCDTAELILENHTQNVPGFLYNKGRGRTEFRRALQKLGSGTYLIGGDTLFAPSNAWLQGGNAFGTTGILGTLDNNHLDFYTNNTQQLRLTNTGNLLLGATADNGAKLQVNGNGTFSALYTNPGIDSGYGVGHIYLNTSGYDIIGTAGHDMIFKTPSTATTFRFQFGSSPHLFESTNDFNISGNNGGNITLLSANKYIDIINLQNIYTDATAINLTSSNYNGGDGVVIQRGPRSTTKDDPVLSLRDSITDVFKVLRSGEQLVTGNVTGLNAAHTIYTPTITNSAGAYAFSSIAGQRIAPTLNLSGDNQLAYAVDISPTYNLNGYAQYTDGVSSALHISSTLGGIRIDQNATYAGNSGQPIYLYQGSASDKEEIVNYRNSTPTLRPFMWNIDNRPAATRSSMISVIRSSLTPDGVMAGAGISYSLDRYYYVPDASIDMKYELAPVSNVDSTLKSAIAFNTVDLGYRSAAIYISGSKVGMGTTTPAAQLHTTGSVRFAGLTSDSTQTRIVVADANGNLYYRSASSLAANNFISSSLAVNGEIRAQKLHLAQSGWPDYVFGSGYQLPALAHIEQYIQQNHHLPDLPSAAEVEKDGIDVGSSQAALLKKIEELTLYIISQEKEINTLKEQNKRLAALEQQVNQLMKLVDK